MALWKGRFGVSATKSDWLVSFGMAWLIICFRGNVFSLHSLLDFTGLETVASLRGWRNIPITLIELESCWSNVNEC
jgi:hypothetical protein